MPETGSTDLSISTRELLDAIFVNAHTTNTFSDGAVDPALIAQAYEDARWAPTAMNSQPMRLTVVHTPDAKQRLGPHMKPGNRDKTLAAPLTIIAAWDPNWHEHLPHLAPQRQGAREKLEPDLAVRENMAKVSSHLQIGYLLVALRAHGLHVGPMTGFNAAGVDEEFHADNGWRTAVIINVGWEPNDGDTDAVRPRAGRLSFDDACQVV
ncbi:malonic semialdehyde reductase [Yaniella halotolerans]|uniref:malonic semialdehyde reductase n=1 Tax=Yaniella halotolerans TaxID=225453 RepID=UPI0003B63140|nr:malonic semialdehyde reductase [Yaniella halotolerans]